MSIYYMNLQRHLSVQVAPETPTTGIVAGSSRPSRFLNRHSNENLASILFRFLMIHLIFNGIVPLFIYASSGSIAFINADDVLRGIAIVNALTHCLLLPVLSPAFRRRLLNIIKFEKHAEASMTSMNHPSVVSTHRRAASVY